MSTYNEFPSTNSIPPAEFYDIYGLSKFLNMNPEFKYYFINYPEVSPYLFENIESLSSIGYDPINVPIGPALSNMFSSQLLRYNEQLALFRKVYAFNSNAYVESLDTGVPPIYFRFVTYKDYTNFKAAVQLVNKLYPFNAMAYGTTEGGDTLGWVVPFPL